MMLIPGEDPGPADVRPRLAVRRAVESHAVLPLDGGHAVQPGQAGLAEDGEGDGLLQPPPGIPQLLLQHPRGLQAETGPVGSHPQVQVGQILGPILQTESLPQTVDGLDVEELPGDLPLGPGQQVLL